MRGGASGPRPVSRRRARLQPGRGRGATSTPVDEREAVDDVHWHGEIQAAVKRVGDAVHAPERRLLLRLFELRVAAHGERTARQLGGRPRRAAVEDGAHQRRQRLRPVAELVIERQVLGARRIRHHALQRGLVLVEELLRRADELLTDGLVLVIGQHGPRAEQPDRAPRHGERGADDLGVVLLRHEAAPRLHEPAVMDVLRAAEGLPRARSELPLEKIAEGLLEDVLHPGEVALANAPDLDLRQAALRIQPRAIDGRPHGAPARSSSSVMIPEWSRPPRPFTRIALKSSWTTAVAGRGTPSARADSMISPRSLKCRSILKPGL